MVLGKIINSMVTANSFGQMDPNIPVNMFTIKNKALVHLNGLTADNTKADGQIANNTEKVNLHKPQAKAEKEYGKMVRELNGSIDDL